MSSRAGIYAGCAWLAIAAVLAVGTYWGVALAGPAGLPTAGVLLTATVLSLLLAAALWTGYGARRVAALSAALGLALASFSVAVPLAGGSALTVEHLGVMSVGLGIVLASAFAFRYR